MRILIVEDEITLALALEEDLAEMGYEVAGVAFTGEEATLMAGNLLPRLVLMDIMLPGSMAGIVAAEIIQGTLNIPVVFLTGHSKKELIERAKAIDPYGYVLKPFNEGQVRASIEIALHKKESEARLMEILDKSGPAGSGRLLSSPLPEKLSTLTPKEILVADLVSQGRNDKGDCRIASHEGGDGGPAPGQHQDKTPDHQQKGQPHDRAFVFVEIVRFGFL